MTTRQVLTNTYIPPKSKKGKHEWYKHDLMIYFDDLKYDEFVSNMDTLRTQRL